jgi:hypothetical protein
MNAEDWRHVAGLGRAGETLIDFLRPQIQRMHAAVLQTRLWSLRVVNILHVRPAKQFNSNAISTKLEVFSAACRIFAGVHS